MMPNDNEQKQPNRVSTLTKRACWSRKDAFNNLIFYDDPVCGDYAISATLGLSLSDLDKFKIGVVLAEMNLRSGKMKIIVTDKEVGEVDGYAQIPASDLLARYPKTPVEVFDRALVNLSYLVETTLATFYIPHEFYLHAHSSRSCEFILSQFSAQGYIRKNESESTQIDGLNYDLYHITSQGWKRIGELTSRGSEPKNKAFVAMWFHDETSETYKQGILPAIEEDGVECIRVDSVPHNNKICDQIIAEIRSSKFVVADFTGNRGGVYFEAGYALGLGIPVIYLVHKDHLKDLHFDTRQYNHIVYDSPEDLRGKLLNRIRATIRPKSCSD